MSWDITIQRFSREYTSVEDIPDDEPCLSLGSRSEIQAAISQAFPATDWSDPAWGLYDSPFGSIEFNLGESEEIDGFMLHVRAAEQVVPMIVALCKANCWQALDCSSGDFLEKSTDPAAGLHAWTAYRSEVVGEV